MRRLLFMLALLAIALPAHAVSDVPLDTVAFASLPSAATYGAGSVIAVTSAEPLSSPCATGSATVIAMSTGSQWNCGVTTPTATSGRYLKGDGNGWITSTGSASGVGACTNQVATTLNSDAAPTCSSLASTMAATGFYIDQWVGGGVTAVSNSVASFFPLQGVGNSQAAAAEGSVVVTAAKAGTLKNLTCTSVNGAGTTTACGGTNYVLAIRQNLGTSIVTCTCATAATGCVDTTHSISVSVGDKIDMITTPSGTPTAVLFKCSAEFDI